MSDTKVSVQRHILKTISYRIIGSLSTVIIALMIGIPIQWSGLIGLGELTIKPIIYFIHERLWYKYIKFGLYKEKYEKIF
jgi:uncharacterized membrane protein